jgi:DNA-binding transcriptional LysR family regulator
MLDSPPRKKKHTISVIVTGKTDQKTSPLAVPRLRVSLRQLEVFVATARGGSTRAAADRVARSQSAASSALAELEAALEAPLFDRIGRRLVLNENGRALLPGAIALLEHAADLQSLFARGHRAPLRIGASLTIGEVLLPERLAQWRATHPHSPVRLMIGNTSEVIAAVAGLDVDVGFVEGPQTHPELHLRPWIDDELVVVAAAGHPLAGRAATHRQLAAAPWILREPGSGTRQVTDAWLLEHLGPLQVEFELGSTEAIKRLAAAGAGLACVSRHAVRDDLDRGALVELRTRLPAMKRRLAIAVRRDRRLGQVTQDFIRHCMAMPAA